MHPIQGTYPGAPPHTVQSHCPLAQGCVGDAEGASIMDTTGSRVPMNSTSRSYALEADLSTVPDRLLSIEYRTDTLRIEALYCFDSYFLISARRSSADSMFLVMVRKVVESTASRVLQESRNCFQKWSAESDLICLGESDDIVPLLLETPHHQDNDGWESNKVIP